MTAFQGKSIVDADNIVFSYGSRRVIDGLTLSISAGEIFGLLGANGARHPPVALLPEPGREDMRVKVQCHSSRNRDLALLMADG